LCGYGAGGAGHIGVIADAVTKPFLTAWLYNRVKKPATRGGSRAPTLEPYVTAAADTNGRPVPLYGVALHF
jgi:hypothetical protein